MGDAKEAGGIVGTAFATHASEDGEPTTPDLHGFGVLEPVTTKMNLSPLTVNEDLQYVEYVMYDQHLQQIIDGPFAVRLNSPKKTWKGGDWSLLITSRQDCPENIGVFLAVSKTNDIEVLLCTQNVSI